MKSSKESLRIARQLLRLTLEGGRFDESRVRLVVRKVKRDRPRGYLRILEAFLNLVRLELAKRHVAVESATALESALHEKVQADLRGQYGEDLTFEFRTKPELLGGMRVRVGSDVWDGSVRARLNQLADAFG